MGVASMSKKTSIKEFNGNNEYDQWLFIYDPRLEQSMGGIIVAAPRGANSPPMPGPLPPVPQGGINPPAPNTQLPPQSPTVPPAQGTPQ